MNDPSTPLAAFRHLRPLCQGLVALGFRPRLGPRGETYKRFVLDESDITYGLLELLIYPGFPPNSDFNKGQVCVVVAYDRDGEIEPGRVWLARDKIYGTSPLVIPSRLPLGELNQFVVSWFLEIEARKKLLPFIETVPAEILAEARTPMGVRRRLRAAALARRREEGGG